MLLGIQLLVNGTAHLTCSKNNVLFAPLRNKVCQRLWQRSVFRKIGVVCVKQNVKTSVQIVLILSILLVCEVIILPDCVINDLIQLKLDKNKMWLLLVVLLHSSTSCYNF